MCHWPGRARGRFQRIFERPNHDRRRRGHGVTGADLVRYLVAPSGRRLAVVLARPRLAANAVQLRSWPAAGQQIY